MSTFEFTDELFEEFKSLYEKSVKDEKESFEFQGYEVLTSYAKYVIQYLEQNDTKRTSSKS
jgi:hypothetical protein